jgi:2-polyprenyl-3-methyl-5-hydroxy-6-metoxy-1,4-benzoquinol methylase
MYAAGKRKIFRLLGWTTRRSDPTKFLFPSATIGFLETPQFDSLRPGQKNMFAGWCLTSDGAAVTSIDVFNGDRILGSCRYGLPRDDVFAKYSHLKSSQHSGFRGNISIPEDLTVPIRVAISDELGRTHNAFEVNSQYASVFRESPPEYLTNANRCLHPACEMHRYLRNQHGEPHATEGYFQCSEFLVHNLARFLESEGISTREKTLLDFACGYGRLARYFVKLFKEVTVSDLDLEMLTFCSREFGTSGFLSSNSAKVLRNHQATYDVVFCFSLFTHLNQRQWKEWFHELFALVADRGYLVISTQSFKLLARVMGMTRQRDAQLPQFFFSAANETSGRLDPDTYGITVIRDSYVKELVSSMKDIRLAKHHEMGMFDLYHDIYIFQKV